MLWWFIFASWASLSLFCLSGSHAALFALAPRLKPPDHRVLPALDDGAAVCASSAKHPTPSSQDCLILGLDLGLLCFFAGLPASPAQNRALHWTSRPVSLFFLLPFSTPKSDSGPVDQTGLELLRKERGVAIRTWIRN